MVKDRASIMVSLKSALATSMEGSLGVSVLGLYTGSTLSQKNSSLNVVTKGSWVKGSVTKFILQLDVGTCHSPCLLSSL